MDSIVITTIQPATASVMAMVEKARQNGLWLIAVGDRKTPDATWPEGVDFLSIANQLEMELKLPALLPENHYARKNLGYLLAMLRGSEVIFDTDDDNAPLPGWAPRPLATPARSCPQTGWVNVYRYFTDAHVWPRGLPLEHARRQSPPAPELGPIREVVAPIQQGLADGSPDVDAVWRLLMDQDIRFDQGDSVQLPPGSWCPFNSQSTWWFPPAYPLMYLPSFVSFRMTDIWRSFVAQRCLWALGHGLVFHGPEMFQDRNPHNLLRDFEQEIPGYLGNDRIRAVLEDLELSAGIGEVGSNCHRCYRALVDAGLVPLEEMPLVDHWLNDVRRVSECRVHKVGDA